MGLSFNKWTMGFEQVHDNSKEFLFYQRIIKNYLPSRKRIITPMRQQGISKLGRGLILNPYREITDGNQAINMLIITQLTKLMMW